MENLYLLIFLFTLTYLSYKFVKKYLQYSYEMKQLQYKFENREQKIEETKPQRFTSLLKDKNSRLEKIIACKNS